MNQTILAKIIVSTVSKIYDHILLNINFYWQDYKPKARDHQSKYMG